MQIASPSKKIKISDSSSHLYRLEYIRHDSKTRFFRVSFSTDSEGFRLKNLRKLASHVRGIRLKFDPNPPHLTKNISRLLQTKTSYKIFKMTHSLTLSEYTIFEATNILKYARKIKSVKILENSKELDRDYMLYGSLLRASATNFVQITRNKLTNLAIEADIGSFLASKFLQKVRKIGPKSMNVEGCSGLFFPCLKRDKWVGKFWGVEFLKGRDAGFYCNRFPDARRIEDKVSLLANQKDLKWKFNCLEKLEEVAIKCSGIFFYDNFPSIFEKIINKSRNLRCRLEFQHSIKAFQHVTEYNRVFALWDAASKAPNVSHCCIKIKTKELPTPHISFFRSINNFQLRSLDLQINLESGSTDWEAIINLIKRSSLEFLALALNYFWDPYHDCFWLEGEFFEKLCAAIGLKKDLRKLGLTFKGLRNRNNITTRPLESMIESLKKLQGLILSFVREDFFLEGEFTEFLSKLMNCNWLYYLDMKVNLEHQKDLARILGLLETNFFMGLAHFDVEFTGIRSKYLPLLDKFRNFHKSTREQELRKRFILE